MRHKGRYEGLTVPSRSTEQSIGQAINRLLTFQKALSLRKNALSKP